MKMIGLGLAGIVGCLCIGTIAVLFGKRYKALFRTEAQEITIEKEFLKAWESVFSQNARVFNGLYHGLLSISIGKARKPEKILREWCQRTHYKCENDPVDILCQKYLTPIVESENMNGEKIAELIKWTNLLLEAAGAAGITREESDTLILNENNVEAYIEWDGNDLYPEDEIEIISPAWYQDGKILEQGQCKMNSAGEQ